MLEVQNLFKSYRGGIHALRGLDLHIGPGMFGLLGPNGAGKSSLMRILAGLQLPDGGSITFNGLDVLAQPISLRRQLGYLPQSFGAYPYIGCRTLLLHMAILKGLPDNKVTRSQIEQLIEMTNLQAHASRAVNNFSGGMRQRFGIAQALLGEPTLLILDEPTTGLDPEERLRLYNLLSLLSADRVVLLSTHIVDDIEQLCGQVAIINAGKIVAKGETDALIGVLAGHIWQGHKTASEQTGAILLSTAFRRGAPLYRYYSKSCPGPAFTPEQPSLEDRYFLELSRDAGVQC